jgi:hypothetical protein
MFHNVPHILPLLIGQCNCHLYLFSLLSTSKSGKSFCPQRFSPLHAVAIYDSPSAQNHGLSQNHRANVNRFSPKNHWVRVGRYILQNIFLDFTTRLSPVIKMADLFPSHSCGQRSHKNRCGQRCTCEHHHTGAHGGVASSTVAHLESVPECNTTFALHI